MAALLFLLPMVASCGGSNDGGGPAPTPPDLRGLRVMLLPVRAPAPEAMDAELAFWLTDRSPTTDWLLPEALQRAVDRAPAWRVRLETLHRPVVAVGRRDRRVGDPLYGVLRQLGAVVDANLAVVPLEAAEVQDSAGPALVLPIAVVDIRGGRVIWLHSVRGEGNPDPRVAVASAAEAVARALFP